MTAPTETQTLQDAIFVADYSASDLGNDADELDVAERALTDHIGALYVDQQDTQAERVREALFALQRVRSVAGKLAEAWGA